jgi:hypothetical protein
MAAWFGATPVLIATAAIVFVPGLLVGMGLRLRGLALWAFAPVATTALTAVLAVLYGVVRVPWSLWTVGVGSALAIAAAWLIGWLVVPRRPRASRHPRALWLLAAGLAIGVTVILVRFAVYVGEPGAVSQTNDAVFHLNAIRYILETSNASSMHVSGVVGGRGFYPSAWHGLASLVTLATGASTPIAANLVSLVIAAAVWPLGIALFAREAAMGSAAVTASAAALSAALPAFPMLMFQWGVLYSYALAVALVPAAAAVVIGGARGVAAHPGFRLREALLLAALALIGLGALALAQPAAILAWLIVVVAWFAWWAGLRIGRADRRGRGVLIASIVAVAVVSAVIWGVLSRSTSGIHWPPFRGKLEVFLDVALNGQVTLPFSIGVSILMFVGLFAAVRRRRMRWLATAWAVFAVLYIVCAAIGQPILRRVLLGAWYGDPYRLAALAPITVVPLAAIGVVAVATWATSAISRRRGFAAETFGTGWALLALALLSVVSLVVAPMIHLPRVTEGVRDDVSRYQTGVFLSADERALLERLPEHVEPGQRVIGNPSTATGFGYAFSGVDVYPRNWAHPRTDEWRTIREGLRYAADDPAVCAALAVYGSPAFVLDFGLGEDSPGRFELPAMTDFAGQDGFELVDELGDASLWRITACDP